MDIAMSEIQERELPVAWTQHRDDEIDLRVLFSTLWRGKWWIVAITGIAVILAIAIALTMPNIYRADALLAPSAEQQGGGLSALAGQFGGLANLAGLDLKGAGNNKTEIAVQIGLSRQFLTSFIRRHQLEVPLLAAKGMDAVTGELDIDPDIYDLQAQKWVRPVQVGQSVEPTDWEVVKAFRSVFSLSEDKKSGLVTISIEYYSPVLAKQWVDWLIADLNHALKQRDQDEANRNIEYLKRQLSKTSIADMQKIFYQLIEEQTKTLMLTEVNQEYVFKTLDPAVVAEEKEKPKRALMVVLGALLGAMLGVMLVLVRHALGRKTP